MISDKLIFISAQPHDQYFQWQLEVQITNFKEHGIANKMHILVWHPKGQMNPGWLRLIKKYPEASFFFYEDEGIDAGLYIPQLRPQILKQHFKKFETELKDKIFFYHDSDIIFNYIPNFELLLKDEINWQSDTSFYLDFTYLKTKEQQGNIPEFTVIDKLSELTGVNVNVIKSYDKNTGGAQYILKDIDWKFWEDVEIDCLKIRKALWWDIPDSINRKYFLSENEGFQSWCADMWAVNFNLWKRDRKTSITPHLEFSWATDHIDSYYNRPIFHNAGAVNTTPGVFYKGNWINQSPIGQSFEVSLHTASSKYVEAIYKVK